MGAALVAAAASGPNLHPGDKRVRAYAEGRATQKAGGSVGDNPHPVGIEIHDVWDSGFNSGANPAAQYETSE